MKTKNKNFYSLSLWVIFSVFFIAACSTDKMEELETDVNLSKASGVESIDLKQGSAQSQMLAQIRAATARYQSLEVAAADGYMFDPHCVEHPEFGGMGHHAINGERIGPFVNHTEPGVLVYEPTRNGRYRLVAVEYLVPAEPWDAMNDGPPMLGEVAFADHREIIFVENDEGELVPVNANGGPPFPHYQLHVWVWKHNPNGMYFPLNPTVNCGFAVPEIME